MAITVIRPRSWIVAPSGGWVVQVGGGTVLDCIKDGSDATIIRNPNPLGRGSMSNIGELDVFTTPAGFYIKQVRANIRGFLQSAVVIPATCGVRMRGSYQVGPAPWTVTYLNSQGDPNVLRTGALTTEIGSWVTNTQVAQYHAGLPWDDAYLNSSTYFDLVYWPQFPNITAEDEYYVYDIWFDVETNAKPVPVVSAPTGTITTTSRPNITWTYTDTESDAGDRYRIKIFNATQYGAVGFDPETSTATWDSSDVALSQVVGGGTYLATPAIDLPDDTSYRAYLKVRQTSDSVWSSWVFSSFALNLDTPALPILSTVVDDVNGRITITSIQARDNLLTEESSNFEVSLGTWAAGASTTATAVNTQALQGSWSMQVQRTGTTGTATAGTAPGLTGRPVAPSTQYTGMAWFKAGTTGRTCNVFLQWYDSAGTFISQNQSSNITDTTGGWTQAIITATSPANAVYGSLVVSISAALAGENHFVDQASIAPGNVTSWFRGGFVGLPLPANQTVIVERTQDGGVTWQNVRGTPIVGPLPTSQLVGPIYDYEAIPNVVAEYRARILGTDDSGVQVAGTNTATQSRTSVPTGEGGWWLKDPLDSTVNIAVDVVGETWDTTVKEESATYMPLGRTKPVVVSDVVRGIDGILDLDFRTQASYDAFLNVRGKQHTLLLQSVITSEQWYIRLGRELRTAEYPLDYRKCRITFVEVDAP